MGNRTRDIPPKAVDRVPPVVGDAAPPKRVRVKKHAVPVQKTLPPSAENRRPYRGEIASAADDIYQMFIRPYNPDLLAVKKGGLHIYKQMREDDQIKACMKLKKAAATTAGWEFKEEIGEEEHRNFCTVVLAQMKGTPEGAINEMLSAFDYGFSLQEKIYSYMDQGAFKGKIGLSELRPKSPTRIEFRIDKMGNLPPDGILQRQDNGKYIVLPQDKFLLYTYQKEFDNFYGESDLKAAYRPYFVKANVLRYWAIYLERFGLPIVKGQTKAGRITDTQRTEYETIVKKIQAGLSVLLPPEITMDLLESVRIDRTAFQQALDACNIAIARAVLIPQLIGFVPHSGVGAYAKAETELKVFDWILKDINRNVEDALNEQLFQPLVEMNFGPQEEYPRFHIKPLKDEDKNRLVAAWSEAVARGAVTSTTKTESYVRKLLAFPEVDEEEEKAIEEAKEALAPDPFGNSGLSGKNPSGGQGKMANAPGSANQYTFIEERQRFLEYIRQLDGIEDEARNELTAALEASIAEMIEDAKKKP